jgi:hypothetical protein
MDIVARNIDSKFVLALGDNFYSSGVTSELDSRFKTSFDQVYTPASLQTDWYVIAGNHGWFI